MGKCNECKEELISTSLGLQGDKGDKGESGENGENGILDWSSYDLSCWKTNNLINDESTNDEISQALIDTVCETYQAINVTPKAVNDYRTMNQDSTIFIQVLNNDKYYPDVTVSISNPPSNGIATIESDNKTIKYIPTIGFIGIEDFDYTITDTNSNTSTATVTIDIQKVISEQTMENIIIEQLTSILANDNYWDLMFGLGDKILISAMNLESFDFTNNITAGKGKTTGRYKKWAICNGNNNTENLSVGTLRGYDHTNTDYDMGTTGKTGGSDSNNFTLSRDNIPPHQHTAGHFGIEFGIQSFNNFNTNNFIPGLTDKQRDSVKIDTTGQNDGTGGGMDFFQYGYNTGDGTSNYNNNKILKSTPDAINLDIRNKYNTVIVIQKISL